MLITHRHWTKKSLKERVAKAKADGTPIGGNSIFAETSLFGTEIKPNTSTTACLDHPKRTKFAQVSFDAEGNISKVA